MTSLTPVAIQAQLCALLGTFPARCQELAQKFPHDYEQACLCIAQSHQQRGRLGTGTPTAPTDPLDDVWTHLLEFRVRFYVARLKRALHELDEGFFVRRRTVTASAEIPAQQPDQTEGAPATGAIGDKPTRSRQAS